jgi:drug/metabolite transporter (DMT)-like permease
VTTQPQLRLLLILTVLGAGWGLTQPLIKIAVTGGYEPLSIIFAQFIIGTFGLGGFLFLRGKPLLISRRVLWTAAMIAGVGTLVPNYAGFESLKTLPAGIYSVLIATIPMIAFPIALIMKNEAFDARRLVGLFVGLIAVGLIIFPDASLPDKAMLAVVPLALIAPICYALEGNLVAKFGLGSMDAIEAMFAASTFGALVTLPFLFMTTNIGPPGAFTAPDIALLLTAIIHTIVYCGYVWLVGKAGPIFASQISYLVTGFGVFWAMLLLGERFSIWIWLALTVMVVGIALVQPRTPLAALRESGDADIVPRT